jgi:hypothetical protein
VTLLITPMSEDLEKYFDQFFNEENKKSLKI